MRHLASIPVVFIEKWSRESGVDIMGLPKAERSAFLRKKLNDSDYQWLRAVSRI